MKRIVFLIILTGCGIQDFVLLRGGGTPLVILQNLLNQSTLTSAFITGTNTSGTQVGCRFDSQAVQNVQGTTSWKIRIPKNFRVGSTHTVTVGMIVGGEFVPSSTVSFRVGQNQDINGDGYADSVFRSRLDGANQGELYIYHSQGSSGFSALQTLKIVDPDATNGDEFGYSSDLGDLNDDGYADLVTGASKVTANNSGKAYIFYSRGASGLPSTPDVTFTPFLVGLGQGFGRNVLIGDFNGDSYNDVTVITHDAANATAYSFHSAGSSGINSAAASRSSDYGSLFFTTQSGRGNFNNDAYSDLVLMDGWGAFGIYYGSSSGLPATHDLYWDDNYSANIRLRTGDFNGDGYSDMVTGDYADNGNRGKIGIHYSHNGTFLAAADLTISDPIGAANDYFGWDVAVGDINRDGYDDLVVTSRLPTDIGMLYIFLSAGTSGIPSTATFEFLSFCNSV